ncbi:hypothetical protein K439DRAFT_1613924 [Ramaria rubella]|nr:hypothetical protein K439DRAFT_1613924 [Ramaria rubella]
MVILNVGLPPLPSITLIERCCFNTKVSSSVNNHISETQVCIMAISNYLMNVTVHSGQIICIIIWVDMASHQNQDVLPFPSLVYYYSGPLCLSPNFNNIALILINLYVKKLPQEYILYVTLGLGLSIDGWGPELKHICLFPQSLSIDG